MYKLVLFDFDGTLGDTFPSFVRHLEAASQRFGFRAAAAEEVEALRSLTAREIMKRLGVSVWKLPALAAFLRKAMAADAAQILLFPGILEVLQTLRQAGVRLAIVSSNSEENVRTILGPETVPLVETFACGASLFGKAKKFQRVLKELKVPASEAICIGDELRDLEAAQAVGIAFGAVTWGYTNPEALRARKPEYMFGEASEIVEKVMGLTRSPSETGQNGKI